MFPDSFYTKTMYFEETKTMIKRFIIYGFAGWSMEIFWTGLHSLLTGDLTLQGYTNLWMFFIYGCAVFLEPISDAISIWRWPIRGFCGF